MAIIKTPPPEGQTEEQQIALTINNGDLRALRNVLSKYGFRNEEAALRFALFVLLKSDDNAVSVKEAGRLTRYVPDDSSLGQ